ncbi:MAG: YkgJ family cysteine cluster protein, partial [Candidatus Wukongarchaeota archaeon]|nr:YkgJ family cysteine cluster protein [Candidatus Wukongarchaeota archaeon]
MLHAFYGGIWIKEKPSFATKNTRFKCIKCGKCCKNIRVQLTIRDLEKLHAANPKFCKKVFFPFESGEDDTIIFVCDFLKDNLCLLHGIAKPLLCQEYPFFFISQEDVKILGLKPPKDAIIAEFNINGYFCKGYLVYDSKCSGVTENEESTNNKLKLSELKELRLRKEEESLETMIAFKLEFLYDSKDPLKGIKKMREFFKNMTMNNVELSIKNTPFTGFIVQDLENSCRTILKHFAETIIPNLPPDNAEVYAFLIQIKSTTEKNYDKKMVGILTRASEIETKTVKISNEPPLNPKQVVGSIAHLLYNKKMKNRFKIC